MARTSVPRRQGGNREAFLHLASEAMLHHFHYTLPLSFWPCWVFTAALGLSLVTAPRLQSTGSGVVARRLSCPEACGIIPDQGRNLSSALVHQGSPSTVFPVTRAHPSSRGGDTDPLSGRDVKSFVAMFPNHHRHRCKKLQNLSTHHEGIA